MVSGLPSVFLPRLVEALNRTTLMEGTRDEEEDRDDAVDGLLWWWRP